MAESNRLVRCVKAGGTSDLATRWLGWMIWGLAGGLILAGSLWGAHRTWLWVAGFTAAGVMCLVNVRRCGRLHCIITGPLFVLAAVATLTSGLGLAAIDWRWILAVAVAGTLLSFGLERACGTYLSPAGSDH